MKRATGPPSRRAVERYRRMLRLLPRACRADAEAEMVEVFRDAYEAVAADGRLARLRLWACVLADTVVTAIAERRAGKRSRTVPGSPLARPAAIAEGFRADVAHALRRLGREPARAIVPVVTLALGIAATVAVLTLVRDVLLKPLPFAEADRLVRLRESDERGRVYWPSFPNFEDWRERASVLDGVAAADVPRTVPVLVGGEAVRARVSGVSRGFFRTMGVSLAVGRPFTTDEERPGGPPVAIVSFDFWRQWLGGQPPGAVDVGIGTERYMVVGVLRPGFRFLGDGGGWSDAAIWTSLDRSPPAGGRQSHGVHVVGRIAGGQAIDQARVRMNQLAAVLEAEYGGETQAHTILMTRLKDNVVGASRGPLELLLVGALALLAIACANLAAVVLARGIGRKRELAIRQSLGATRGQLARVLVVETMALALPGAVLGAALAAAALGALRGVAPAAIPRMGEVSIDGVALTATVVIAVASAVAAGLLPALSLGFRHAMGGGLVRGGPPGREHRRLWNGFVATQLSLTLALLVAAGLLLRGISDALRADLGYDADRVLAVDIALPESLYPDDVARDRYITDAMARLRALPGAAAVGIASVLPDETTARTSGTSTISDGERSVFAGYRLVDAGYFDALRIPVDRGALSVAPPGAATVPAVVDASLADALWSNGAAIGESFANGFHDGTLVVSGISGTVREIRSAGTPGAVYVDYRSVQARDPEMHFVVRADGDPAMLMADVRAVLRGVDPQVPVALEPFRQRVAASLADRALILAVAAAFAVVALVLAVVGVHAVVACAARRRLREMGIRLVLGAAPGHVQRAVVRSAAPAVAVGFVAGSAAAVAAGALLRSRMSDMIAFDPAVLGAAILVLAAAAAVAALVPARRAARTDPAAVLRSD